MKYYMAGGEVPSHRKVLSGLKASHVAVSFVGLSRKIKNLGVWHLEDKFPEDTTLFLDSGAHSINGAEAGRYSLDDVETLERAYRAYIEDNLDRIDLVSEFDALPLGREQIEANRTEFYDTLPDEKFMPIWHAEWGIEDLKELAQKYQNIGITATSLAGRNLEPILNQIADSGIHLHGVGMTSVPDMYAIRWTSVSSTSWISPQQYGDTIIWTGKQLKRYPRKQKDQARKRYRTYLSNNGFDAEKIEADDTTELLRLSAWSWARLMEDIDRQQHNIVPDEPEEVTNPTFGGEPVNTETGEVGVVNPTPEVRKALATRRETHNLPVLGAMTTQVKTVDDDGNETTTDVATLNIRSESTRVCDNCFLANKCPAFEPNATCAYNIPIEIKTKDQFAAVQNSLIEMQAQRVMFMRFAEEQEGGYADPNLSGEIDRLQKLLKTKNDMEQDGVSFKIEGKASGEAARTGMLGRLFGNQASDAARALPAPVPADAVIVQQVEPDFIDVDHYEVPS